MWLGINAPERVDRLVLLCTSPQLGPPEMWADRAKLVREQGTEAIVDATIERWFTDAYRDEHDRPRLRAMFVGIDDEGYANCCAVIEHMDLSRDARRASRRRRSSSAARRTRRRRRRARRADRGRRSRAPAWRSSTPART